MKGWEEGFRFTEMTRRGGGGGQSGRTRGAEVQKGNHGKGLEGLEMEAFAQRGVRLPCAAGSTLQEGDGWDRARAAR